jgi:CysZ protein
MLFSGWRIFRLALIPIAVSLLVFIATCAACVWLASWLGGSLANGGWGTFLAWLLGVLAFLAFLVAGFFAFGAVAALVAAPFNGPLSSAVERRLTGSTGELCDRSAAAEVWRTISATCKLAGLELTVMLPSLLLLLLPAIGALAYAALASFFLALNYLDQPLDRRKLRLREKLAFCRLHLAETLGFGTALYLVMMVPVLNLLAIPAAAAGATELYLKLASPQNAQKASGP